MPRKDYESHKQYMRERQVAETPEQREARLTYQRAYYQANGVKMREQFAARRAAKGREYNAEVERAGHLRRKYGITPEHYDELLASQGGLCAGCGTDKPGKAHFSVDHDHVTGKVRGLLCHSCNLALGFVEDDPDRLLALAAYVLQNQDVLAELGQGA